MQKAHTINRAGTVKLRSADPRDPPDINFHYFHEGTDIAGHAMIPLLMISEKASDVILAAAAH